MVHVPLFAKGVFLAGILAIIATEALVVSASAQWALTAGIGITAAVSIATGYFQILARRDANARADRAEELRAAREKREDENRKAEKEAREAVAAKVAKVAKVAENEAIAKDEQNKKLDGMAKVLDKTHTLVNSKMMVQLKLTAVALRSVAELTKGTARWPEDEAAAVVAEKLAAEHEEKQAEIDAIPKG